MPTKPGGPACSIPQALSIVARGLKGDSGGSFAERMGRSAGKKLPSYHSTISARVKGPCRDTHLNKTYPHSEYYSHAVYMA